MSRKRPGNVLLGHQGGDDLLRADPRQCGFDPRQDRGGHAQLVSTPGIVAGREWSTAVVLLFHTGDGEHMSDEAAPDVTWEEIADSWRLDELVEGRMRPTTSDDVLTLMTIGALHGRRPLNEVARWKAFDAMLAAGGGAVADENSTPRDRARIEQTRQAALRAFEEAQQRKE
jgi:hypothetical protein